MKNNKCPLCKSEILSEELFRKENVFVSIGKIDNSANESPNFGEIDLFQCDHCGYIFNSAFDLEKVNKEYNSKNYVLKKIVSTAMSKNLQGLKERILKFTTSESLVMEIGCGDGALACAIAPNVKHIYTVDPSVESINLSEVKNITHINDYYSFEKVSSITGKKVDVIILRHLLEHISEPSEFISEIISLLNNDGIIYIEVPNAEEIIQSKRFYDIFHDHFGYFSQNGLENYFLKLGFSLKEASNLFNEQHLGLFFMKTNEISAKTPKILKYSNCIKQAFSDQTQKLNEIISNYTNIAIYGAGAHGNSILNYINSQNKGKISICFDKDKSKQNKYLQASNIKIKEPTEDNFKNIDLIIMASSLYEDEIAKQLIEGGYKGKILKTANVINLI